MSRQVVWQHNKLLRNNNVLTPNNSVYVQFRGTELFKKKGALFQEELYPPGIYMPSQTSWWYGWSHFKCNFNVCVGMILPYGSHCIDMTASPEPIDGVTDNWLSCFATCDRLRGLVPLHCDLITASTTKTWWSCRSLVVELPCLRKTIFHQNTMLRR